MRETSWLRPGLAAMVVFAATSVSLAAIENKTGIAGNDNEANVRLNLQDEPFGLTAEEAAMKVFLWKLEFEGPEDGPLSFSQGEITKLLIPGDDDFEYTAGDVSNGEVILPGGAIPVLFSAEFDMNSVSSGKFTVDTSELASLGYEVNYVATKGGPFYNLTSVHLVNEMQTWTTDGITVGNGNTPGLSHLSFYGMITTPNPEVPELASSLTWLGLFGVAAATRRSN